ncbi:phenylacetate--CoA ligase family protein [uncultured Sulfitobacter sp.]|uniref:phenylacetate--CoA ligase family protein n=1 Tax=uncultured Sulfitobacter sp. TaxID=191468 RepID=UPI00260CF7BF|nr:AMP-binding protein [uncultured Sulfitobacter sp.]
MTDQQADLEIPADRDALFSQQADRRRRAVERARSAPFYAGKLDHLNLDRITEEAEWAKIPILDKEQLRAMDARTFYEDFCISGRREIVEYWRSGGSTGKPLFYPRTAEDIRFGQLGFKRALHLAGFGPDDIAHMSMPLGIHPAGHMMARSGSDAGVGMVWAGGGNTLPSATQLDLVSLFQPTAWIGMASYGIQLGNLAKTEGLDLAASSVERILCSAEPLSASKRQKLSELWGAPVRDCYGMTEAMMLGCEDASMDGFRFWSDFCYPEVLDPDTLEPVAEGTPGLLIITALVTNNATPFVRWNTGDIVTLRTGVTGAGVYDVFPLVKHTHRTAGFVKVRGINIGFTDLEDLMFANTAVSDFRVEIVWQNDRDELDVYVELADDAAGATDQISADIRRVFGLIPRIHVGARGEIAQRFEGAFKPVRVEDLRG